MELGDAIYSAVTTRYFSDEPVTDQQLETAFDYARFAPQGGNRQPVRFVVVRDQDKRNQLGESMRNIDLSRVRSKSIRRVDEKRGSKASLREVDWESRC